MSKSYKATKKFSFGGKNYVEGQEVNITDADELEVLERRKQISSGKGTAEADLQAQKDAEAAKKSAEADKQRQAEADAREEEYRKTGGLPKRSTNAPGTPDVQEKISTSGPNGGKK